MTPESSAANRLPPYSIEAERAVLGGVLLNNEVLNNLVDIIKKEDFFKESHQILFELMTEMVNQDQVIDLISLKNELEKQGLLEAVGGVNAISALLDEISSVSNLDYYASIIKDKSTLRTLIRTAETIVQKGYKGTGDVKELVDQAESSIFEIAQSGEVKGPQHIGNIIRTTFDNLSQLSEKASIVTGISTGFSELDRLTTGFHPGELIIVAARPAMGKTTFGLNLIQNIATNEKVPALIFSLEMTEDQLVQRMLCSKAEVDGQDLRRGRVHGDDWSRLARAAGDLSKIPVFIDDSPSLSVLEMRSRARRIKSKMGDLGVVMVDYLQLMQSRSRFESRQLEISAISRSLKFMAKELACPVIALSQLSRAVENRTDKRPLLSDLRESGAIEQDADVVLFLYRPEKYDISEIKIHGQLHGTKNMAEIIIGKQRNGPTASVFLAFRENLLQFKDAEFNFKEAEMVSYPEERSVPFPEEDYEM